MLGNAGMSKVQKLSDISLEALPRFTTGFLEFDRVLGGGVIPGSVILIGGNSGTGKSTLLLQVLCKLSEQMKTLYVSWRRVAIAGSGARPPSGAADLWLEYACRKLASSRSTWSLSRNIQS